MKRTETPYGELTDDEKEAVAWVARPTEDLAPPRSASERRLAFVFAPVVSRSKTEFLTLFGGCLGYVAGVEAERARAARSAKVHAALVECSVALRHMVCADGDLLRTNEAFASALYGEAAAALARLEAAQKEAQP